MTSPVYFTVEADFKAFIEDASTDSDYDPQVVPISATVTFTPLINAGDVVLATDASPRPTGFIPAPITAIIDPVDGRLKMRTGTDVGATGFSFAPVRLLGSSALLELDGPLEYSVRFSEVVFSNGRRGTIAGFNFEAPNSDTVLNLIEVARVPGQVQSGITKIAPTNVRFQNNTMIFSFAGSDIPDALPLSAITGPVGATGAAATITVGSTTTSAPGGNAAVTATGSTGAVSLAFTIPRGSTGPTGATGPQGASGVPGEVTLTATQTLTNKTLTSPRINDIRDTNGNLVIETVTRPSAANYLQVANATTAGSPEILAAGTDANLNVVVSPKGTGALRVVGGNITPGSSNVNLNLTTLGTGTVQANSVDVVTTTGTQTLTGKTLTSPKVNELDDVNGNTSLNLIAVASAVNYLQAQNAGAGTGPVLSVGGTDTNASFSLDSRGVGAINLRGSGGNGIAFRAQPAGSGVNYVQAEGASTGNSPALGAQGTDTNLNLNLTAKGTGVVQVNGVPVVTTTGSQAVTNKTISGTNNTITNLPASATPDAARLVCTTQVGSSLSENGANTWAKLATFIPGSNKDTTVILAVTQTESSAHHSAIISVYVRQGASGNPIVDVQMLSKAGSNTGGIGADSFKIISGGAFTSPELWMKKQGNYLRYRVYEISKAVDVGNTATVTYHNDAPWQSAVPTGEVNNVSTNGVTAFGNPVGVKVAVPATATSTGVVGQWAADSSWHYVCTATNTWRRAALASW